jgi:hypothetical protein
LLANNQQPILVLQFQEAREIGSGKLTILGFNCDLWLSRPTSASGKPKSWEFCTDACGRWHVNIQVEVSQPEKCHAPFLGIDLGLNNVLSNGFKILRQRAGSRARGPRRDGGAYSFPHARAWPRFPSPVALRVEATLLS